MQLVFSSLWWIGASYWLLGAEGTCRMDSAAAHEGCGLPYELSNFQGYHACDPSALIGTPADVEGLRRVVTSFPHVKAVGVGHSWDAGFFCPGNSSDSVGIVMTEIKNVQDLYTGQTTTSSRFPIQVNEQDQTVWVEAGVSQRILLNYLSKYGSGYTLAAFPWFIDQTIGGAVATGSHGSSLRFGSLSSQVITFEVMLADGSVRNVTAADPHLFRAFKVSVGRLGIILRLQMRIVPDTATRRTLSEITFSDLVQQLKSFQTSLSAAIAANSPDAIDRVLHTLDETQMLWYVPTSQVWRVDYEHLQDEPPGALLNLDPVADEVQAFDGPDVSSQTGRRPIPPNRLISGNPTLWSNYIATGLRQNVQSGTYEKRDAYLTMSAPETKSSSSSIPYDQYEVSIPLELIGDCLEAVGAEIYGPDRLSDGFRSPPLIRFVAAEDAYLSPTNGGPRMYMNMEDYLYLSTGVVNWRFQKVVSLFMTHEKCGGSARTRLHWGKAGWDASTGSHNANFDGAVQYPDTWCHFGCAVAQLDPTGKFQGQRADLWTFTASYRNSTSPVQRFGTCCSPNGFLTDQCKCLP